MVANDLVKRLREKARGWHDSGVSHTELLLREAADGIEELGRLLKGSHDALNKADAYERFAAPRIAELEQALSRLLHVVEDAADVALIEQCDECHTAVTNAAALLKKEPV